MNIGQPQRIIEVEPASLPVPATLPDPKPMPRPAPSPAEPKP